jgi:hypothetical protein
VTVLVLTLVGGALPVVLARHFGAWDIPRNDDWSYILSAFRLADGHGLNGNGWASMNLVGQLVPSVPVVWLFGHRIAALQVEVALIGVVGLLAVFDLAKSLLTERRALFLAVMVAVGPLWASLTVSYMTDVPAFALAMVCLALGVRAVRPEGLRGVLFTTAVLVGFLAFSVREYGVIAPIAVILGALWSSPGSGRRRLTGLVVALLGLLLIATAFLAWRRGLPGFTSLTPRRPNVRSVKAGLHAGAQSAVLVGLLVSPAVLLAGPTRLFRTAFSRAPRTSAAVGISTCVALGAEMVRHLPNGQFLSAGNYVLPNGTLGTATLSGERPDLFAIPLLAALAVVGVVAVALLALAAVPPVVDALRVVRRHQLPSPKSPALAIVSLAAVGYGASCLLGPVFRLDSFDRQLLPVIPLVGVLVLSAQLPAPSTLREQVVAGLALTALAVFGLIYAANSASWDGTRWTVAERAANTAGGAKRVDGGFEWTNYHAGRPIFATPRVQSRQFCITLRARAHPTNDSDVPRARVWGPTGTQTWIVAHQRHPC